VDEEILGLGETDVPDALHVVVDAAVLLEDLEEELGPEVLQ